MSDKMIRFIDTDYNTLFTIPDGGSIVITHAHSNEQHICVCQYLDETHAEINGERFNLRQLAVNHNISGARVEPEKEPEMVGSYRVIHRIPVGDKVYVMGHSPKAAQPYGTWQAYRDVAGKDWGHYWSSRSDAVRDLRCRAESERTGKPYDHTKRYKQLQKRNDAR